MIVKGMNYEEIIKECCKDFCECGPRAFKILESDKKLKKFILNLKKSCIVGKQHPRKYYFKYFTLTSKNNNTVLILPAYHVEDKEFGIYNLVLYNFGSGYHVVEPTLLGGCWGRVSKIYTPHFFDRFRERELKNPNLSKFDVIDKFFKIRDTYKDSSDGILFRKSIRSMEMLPEILEKIEEKYPENSYVEPYGDRGLIILESFSGLDIVKTYLSFDILKDNQLDVLAELVLRSDILL